MENGLIRVIRVIRVLLNEDMAQIRTPEPVVLVAAVMVADVPTLSDAKERLRHCFGEIVLESAVFPFDFSTYYRREMGEGLLKQFVSFSEVIPRETLPEIKRTTGRMEEVLGTYVKGDLRRRANMDPGYVSPAKLVLASTKNYDHRIYLRDGIFAEITLRYRHGRFDPMEWTYPDYRTDLARAFFTEVREHLLARRRAGETFER